MDRGVGDEPARHHPDQQHPNHATDELSDSGSNGIAQLGQGSDGCSNRIVKVQAEIMKVPSRAPLMRYSVKCDGCQFLASIRIQTKKKRGLPARAAPAGRAGAARWGDLYELPAPAPS